MGRKRKWREWKRRGREKKGKEGKRRKYRGFTSASYGRIDAPIAGMKSTVYDATYDTIRKSTYAQITDG